MLIHILAFTPYLALIASLLIMMTVVAVCMRSGAAPRTSGFDLPHDRRCVRIAGRSTLRAFST